MIQQPIGQQPPGSPLMSPNSDMSNIGSANNTSHHGMSNMYGGGTPQPQQPGGLSIKDGVPGKVGGFICSPHILYWDPLSGRTSSCPRGQSVTHY